MLMAELLIAVREYNEALVCLDSIVGSGPVGLQMRADSVMLRLLALRGKAYTGDIYSLAGFRSLTLSAMDRFPRDPRPLRIFFEYAHNKKPYPDPASVIPLNPDLPYSDAVLMELVLRRLPFLLEADPELAWMAAPFIRDIEETRRLVTSYRAGGIPHIRNRDFYPHPGSIPVALNLGLLDDRVAVEELFSGNRGFNNPQPREITPNGSPVLNKDIMSDTYYLLRSEEGRDFFTRKLHSFTGYIFSDDDHDGYIDSAVYYNAGSIEYFLFYLNQNNIFSFLVNFTPDNVPEKITTVVSGRQTEIFWERYPFVERAVLGAEIMEFRPADFQYTPFSFIEIGGSNNLTGLLFPQVLSRYSELTYRTLVSFCSKLSRPGTEFDGSVETFFIENGIPLFAVETLGEKTVSNTEFVRGNPVIQYVDLDLDGRMETIRLFRYPPEMDSWLFTDYRSLIVSSESDWRGDGLHITRELYLPDGSVVYSWDMDGSGEQNYYRIGDK